VIHRDIKPGNMMLTPSGVIKLMDFGIARSGNELGLTVTGTTLGSLAYMSPEQVKCEPIDARSDLYSVGISLYEMVTGQKPFKGDSNFSIMQAQLQQTPKPPAELSANLPPALNQIILMAMSKDPAQRFQTADAFRNALKSVASGMATKGATVPMTAPAPASTAAVAASAASMPPPPPQANAGGHRGLYIGLGAAIVLVVLVAAGFSAPRWFKTRANSGPSSQTNHSTPAQPANDANGAAPVSPAPATATGTSDTGATSPQVNPPPDQPAAPGAATVTAPLSNPAGKNKLLATSGGQQAESQAIAPPPQPDPAQLAELDHEMDQITSREAAANASLDSFQRAQSSQGLQLRGDIVAAQQRMQMYAAKAQAALQAQDIDNTKKYLGLMESELGKLEKFLGN
jgi:serine/threonine-protein kinase